MGKAFEKQVKTIEDQREKQVDALKAITYKSDDNDNTFITKEIYDEILAKRMDEILKMKEEINFENLVYDFTGSKSSINVIKYGGIIYIYNQLKKGEKTL